MTLTVNSALPWLIDVDVFEQAVAHTNWDTISINNLCILNATLNSSGAQNDEVNYDVVLSAGTWTVELLHTTGTDRGIYSIQFDSVEKGTIDGYAGSGAANTLSSVTGIAVATSAKVRLKVKMATKNGSSSNYTGTLQHIQLRRTA